MGTRSIFEVKDENEKTMVVLFANSSHPFIDPLDVIKAHMNTGDARLGATGLVTFLLNQSYILDGGNHYAGDRMFWLMPLPLNKDEDYELHHVITRSSVSNSWKITTERNNRD